MIPLIEIALRSSVILAVGLALMPLLRRQSAALRHWVLATTLVCSAVVPIAAWLLPAWVAPLDVSSMVPPAFSQSMRPPQLREPSLAGAAIQRASEDASNAVDAALAPQPVVMLWFVGASLSIAALGIGLMRLRRIDAAATALDAGTWVDTLRSLQPSHGVHQPVAVRMTARPSLLFVWGVWRPTIIVPSSALGWSRDRVQAVVTHELAHIHRRDWLFQIVAEVVRAIYWFNPLVWVTCARLRRECEVACDDRVIATGAQASEYASHVIAIARDLQTSHWLPAPAIVRSSTLERRVRAMLDKTLNRQPPSTGARGGALALLLSLTVVVASLAAQSFVSLSGTIVDTSNGVLPGVKLLLTNDQTQAKYEIQTDQSGRYEFVGLPPGNYRMEAMLPGFSQFSGRVTVGGQNLQQDVTMSVGMIQETITVRQDATPPAPDPERDRRIEEIKKKRAASRCPAVQPGGDMRIGGNIRVPVKYRDFRPSFPESLHGTEGVVVLKAAIGPTGNIEDVDVISSTHPDFTHSAIEAVRQWEFDATLLNCEPITTPMTVTVNYKVR
jgi:TonB family protein